MSVDGRLATEASIRAGTYAGFQGDAVVLYGRVQSLAQSRDEPVDFGRRAIDVGSRDERHRSLIEALVPGEVIGIEPNRTETARAFKFGVAREGEVFRGTLQEWATTDPAPADSAFVFNVLRRLIEDRDFVGALRSSVAAGGIAVFSFMRSDAVPDFVDTLPQLLIGFRRLEGVSAPQTAGVVVPKQAQVRNTNLSIWRRED